MVESTNEGGKRYARPFKTMLLCGAVSLFLPCVPSHAQELASEAATAATAVTDDGGIGEILVTARRRQESLQDTPISISAVTADALGDRGVQAVTDIGDFTPNVKFNSSMPISANNATSAIYIRGIGQNDYQLSADPGVGLYLDGVYISRGVGNVLDVLNIERIEVLRGPQGTLFGRNTIGGAVSVVTRKPAETFQGSVDLTVGSLNRAQIKGTLDVPLADGLYTSLSVFSHRRDGYVKGAISGAPTLGDTNTLAGRFAVRAEPTSTLTINISADATRSREESAPVVMIAVDETSTAAQIWNGVYSGSPGICANPSDPSRLTNPSCYNSQWALAPYRQAGTFTSINSGFVDYGNRRYESASDLNVYGLSGTISWQVADSLTLKSITAYRKVDGFWSRDADHSPATIVQTKSEWKQDQFSQEIQIVGEAFDKKLNWVLGAYYADERGNHKDVVNLVDAYALGGAVLEGRSIAAFAQATYEIVDNLSLTGGMRWTEDRKTFFNDNQIMIDAGFLTGAPLNPDGSGLQDGDPLMGPPGEHATLTSRAWTPALSLSYRFSPSLFGYVSYSQGFKGGGFTQRVFPPTDFIPSFKPETAKTYEIGLKADLFDRRIRINGAIFRNNFDNLQLAVLESTLGLSPIIQNAAKARIEGVELEVQARPIDALRLEAGIGYLRARYIEVDIRAFNAGITRDTKLQNAPKWTLSGSAAYEVDLGDAGSITPRVDWSYRSKVYNDAINTALLTQGGYHLVNVAINYKSVDDHYGLSFGVKNVTKELYLTSGFFDSFGGITEGVYGRPREWYLSGRFSF